MAFLFRCLNLVKSIVRMPSGGVGWVKCNFTLGCFMLVKQEYRACTVCCRVTRAEIYAT